MRALIDEHLYNVDLDDRWFVSGLNSLTIRFQLCILRNVYAEYLLDRFAKFRVAVGRGLLVNKAWFHTREQRCGRD